MKKVFYSLIIIVLFTNNSWSQKIDTICLYYKINESSIQQKNYHRLDSIIKFLGKFNSIKIAIYGFADESGTDQYNFDLSKVRANTIKTYIINKGISPNIISICEGRGKIKTKSGFGKLVVNSPSSRKVEIVLINNNTLTQASGNNSKAEPAMFIDSSLLINVKRAAIGDCLLLKNINFYPSSSSILEESKHILNELLLTLRELPTLKIEIQGHVCCVSKFDDFGNKISIERAKAVYDYLISNQIDSTRLKYKGYGSSRLLIKNEFTDEDRNKNRRVEIKIIEK